VSNLITVLNPFYMCKITTEINLPQKKCFYHFTRIHAHKLKLTSYVGVDFPFNYFHINNLFLVVFFSTKSLFHINFLVIFPIFLHFCIVKMLTKCKHLKILPFFSQHLRYDVQQQKFSKHQRKFLFPKKFQICC
jgi:hypothetical protein